MPTHGLAALRRSPLPLRPTIAPQPAPHPTSRLDLCGSRPITSWASRTMQQIHSPAQMRVGSSSSSSRSRQAFSPAVARGPVHRASAAATQRLRSVRVAASLQVKDKVSGIEFPLAQTFWEGEEFRCLGASTRSKKILIVAVQVYSVALYVEAAKAAKELGIRSRGGFFESEADYCQAVLDGAFSKVLKFQLLRDVTGEQFSEAVDKRLKPRMQITGELSQLQQLNAFFQGQQLTTGTQVIFLWNGAGDLEVEFFAPGALAATDLRAVAPKNRIAASGLSRAFFEMFLGGDSLVPDAQPLWVAAAKELLDSENVKRASRKAGSG